MPITKEQARDIAKQFLDLSHNLGAYRFNNWDTLSQSQRQTIEDIEWDLLNYSSSFTTTAVGIALNDMETDLKAISDATVKAKQVIQTIETVKKVIKVASALVVLGGAIASQNPSAIASAAVDAVKAASDALK
jgi:hypothetical protein